MNATTLREMLNKDRIKHGDRRAGNALVDPLLDVLEAAEAYQTWMWPNGPTTESDRFCANRDGKALEAAIAALYRRAGEVMDGK